MKSATCVVLGFIIIASLFSLNFTSASWFSDILDRITGNAISVNSCNASVILGADNMASYGSSYFVNIANKGQPLELKTYQLLRGVKTKVNSSIVSYEVYHPVFWRINATEASSIISVDNLGRATYKNEGYVFVKATVNICGINRTSNSLLVVTGNVYGDVQKDNVIAIFPRDYSPENSSFSFGSMMKNYPDYIKIINMAYGVESSLYGGFKPFNQDKQLFALLDLPNHCGGNGNPLETAPCCYMDCGSGSPQYDVVIHEMAHNFAYSLGMNQLLFSNNNRFNNNGFGECVASLPLQYLRAKILENPQNYNISQNSFEYSTWASFQNQDNIWNKERLERFEGYIRDGSAKGIFDIESLTPEERDSLQGNVGAFCSMFVTLAAYASEYNNSYGWDFYERFFSFFGDKNLANFQEEGVETYFSAAFSAAAGQDLREKLKFWGFYIEDEYFNQIYPVLLGQIEDSEEYVKPYHPGACRPVICGEDTFVRCESQKKLFLTYSREVCKKN